MLIETLYKTHDEIKNIIFSGCEQIKSYGSLFRLSEELMNFGENSDVCIKIASLIKKAGDETDCKSEYLLDAYTLISSVLNTQCRPNIYQNIENTKEFQLDTNTDISFSQLNTVMCALCEKFPDRLSILEKAYKENCFKDLRLIYPLIDALDDKSSEIAQFAEKVLITKYGLQIIDILKSEIKFNEESRGDARKLSIISKLTGSKNKEFYYKLLSNNIPTKLKAAAISALKNISESTDILIEFVSDRKKEIREAAYEALSFHQSDKAIDTIIKALESKDADFAVNISKNIQSVEFVEKVLSKAEQLLIKIVDELKFKSNKNHFRKENKSLLSKILLLFRYLQVLNFRNSERVYLLCKKCIENYKYFIGINLEIEKFIGNNCSPIEKAAEILLFANNKTACSILEETLDNYNNYFFGFVFEAMLNFYSPEEIFDIFSKYLARSSKSQEAKIILAVIKKYLLNINPNPNITNNISGSIKIMEHAEIYFDNRWAEIIAELKEDGNLFIIEKLVKKGDEKSKNFFLNIVKRYIDLDSSASSNILSSAVRGLIKCGYEDVFEIAKKIINYNVKKKTKIPYQQILDFIDCLKNLDKKFFNQIIEYSENIEYKVIKNALIETAHSL